MENQDSRFNCPDCRSENTMKASVLSQKETQGYLMGQGTRHQLNMGTITSELASNLAKRMPQHPPFESLQKRRKDIGNQKIVVIVFIVFLLVLSLIGLFGGTSDVTGMLIGVLLIGLAVFLAVRANKKWFPNWEKQISQQEEEYRQQEEEYPRKLAEWEKAFVCTRCGLIFMIDDNASAKSTGRI